MVDNENLVPGLARGMRVLMAFTVNEPELSAADLSTRLSIPQTSVFRILHTLEALGLVEKSPAGRCYRLGIGVLRLGFDYLSGLDLTDLGNPILERLRDLTGHSSHLVIRDGRDIVFIAKAQCFEKKLRSARVNIGTRLPAHATIHGRVLLGDLSLAELAALYPETHLEQITGQTPPTVDDLHRLIRIDHERGFAESASPFDRDISVITAPVRDGDSRIVAAVTVTIPEASNTGGPGPDLIDLVRGAANALSAWLSCGPRVAVRNTAPQVR